MDKLAACLERESCDPITGEPGILRKEFRVDLISDWDYEALQNAWGTDWQWHSPGASHVLAMRYIRRGVEEPWEPFQSANSFEHALEYIDDKATPLCSELHNLQKRRAEAAAEVARREAEQREAEQRKAEHAQLLKASRDAFDRLHTGSTEGHYWCDRWNDATFQCHEREEKQPGFLSTLATGDFRELHDAVIFATKVPAKRKAIKAALAWLEANVQIGGCYRRREHV